MRCRPITVDDCDDVDDDDDDDDMSLQLDVNGECETKYMINSEAAIDYSSVSNMKVTKVKNFDKCLTRNSFEEGVFAGLPHHSTEKVMSLLPSFLLSPSFLLPFYCFFYLQRINVQK